MNEIFEKNLQTLQKLHPELYDSLRTPIEEFRANPLGNSNEQFHLLDTQGQKNFIYIRKDPEFRALYHSENPEVQAKEVLSQTDLKFPTILVFFGIGLGHLLKEYLKNRSQHNFSILIVEKNSHIFMHAMAAFDWSLELEDSTISWFVNKEISQARTFLLNYFQINTTVSRSLKVLGLPNAISSEDSFYADTSRALLQARDHTTLLIGNSVSDCFEGFDHTITNLPEAIRNSGVEYLFDQFKNQTCVSVAAGPSVNEHWETLKRIQGKVPIIACDTVLKPMLEPGIFPDFVTALERCDIVTDFFRGLKIPERSALVGPTLLLKESFDAFHGEHLMYAPSGQYTEYLGLDYLGRFYPGSSAGNLNTTFATVMGFKNIIMVGHNLAYGYKTNESHLRGTIDKSRERSRTAEELKDETKGLKAETQDGTDIVWTRMEWNLYREQFENLIDQNPARNYINTALKGAKIRGAKFMSFEEALQKYATEDLDIFPIRRALKLQTSSEEIQKREKRLLEKVQIVRLSLHRHLEAGRKILKMLKKWKAKIENKHIEGKFVSETYLDEALDQVLQVKIAAINDDRQFYQAAVSIILPYHMTFERIINQMPGKYTSNYELKKDFLLVHEQYFETWNVWLPKIIERLERLSVNDAGVFTDSPPPIQLPFHVIQESLASSLESGS